VVEAKAAICDDVVLEAVSRARDKDCTWVSNEERVVAVVEAAVVSE